MNFFPLSSFCYLILVAMKRFAKSCISLMNLFETVGALFFIKKAYPKNPLTLV